MIKNLIITLTCIVGTFLVHLKHEDTMTTAFAGFIFFAICVVSIRINIQIQRETNK